MLVLGDKIIAEGYVDVSALYVARTEGQPMHFVAWRRAVPVEAEVVVAGAEPGMEAEVHADVTSLELDLLNREAVEADVRVQVEAKLTRPVEREAIVEAVAVPPAEEDPPTLTFVVDSAGGHALETEPPLPYGRGTNFAGQSVAGGRGGRVTAAGPQTVRAAPEAVRAGQCLNRGRPAAPLCSAAGGAGGARRRFRCGSLDTGCTSPRERRPASTRGTAVLSTTCPCPWRSRSASAGAPASFRRGTAGASFRR